MLRVILAAIVLGLVSPLLAETPKKFLVELNVRCEKCEEALTSLISRELRSLLDVEIVQKTDHPYTGEKFELSIVALKDYNKKGDELGYSISYVATKRINTRVLNNFFNQRISDAAERTVLAIMLDEVVTKEDHRIYSVGPDGLKGVAEKIVAAFDMACLEPIRTASSGTSKP